MLLLILLALVERALGGCAYADLNLPANASIVVADSSCTSAEPVCAVRPNCSYNGFYSTRWKSFVQLEAIGDLSNYTQPSLSVADSSLLELAKMKLPSTLTNLTLTNITARIDLGAIAATQWSSLQSLTFHLSNIEMNNGINWPPSLRFVVFKDTDLVNIPQGLPSTVESLAIEDNKLVDLTYLPDNLTFLNLTGNFLASITDRDWRALTFLRLSRNKKLQSITRVQLSTTKLEYFDMRDCPQLTNITIDASTFAALEALPNAGDADQDSVYRGFAVNKHISTDAANCSAVNGTIQRLWKFTSKYIVDVCVLPVAPSLPAPSTTNTGLIIGVVVGGLVVLGAIIAFVIWKRRNVNNGRAIGRNGTNGAGGDTTGTHRTVINPDVDVILDVKPLLHHRLELSDLYVTSDKPLASGAFGEVWLGSYGGKRVAIKRMKNQDARMAQKFIDEIVLMSQMSSDYIVKFVGASWTRPIEIECVVEYMDLGDLRSYLVNQSPAQFSWDQKLNCILSIACGLVYLHTYKPPIIHRDLKSRHVLLDSVKGTKLTDFGESRVAEEDDLMTNGIGTYQWMAPEVISATNYGAPADVYSFGIILSEFATHQVPYADKRHPTTGKALPQHYVLQEVREGRLQPTLNGPSVPSWVQDIAKQCLQLHEEDRPTSLELASMLNKCRV
ncbi:TKL protein kinase [Saprolegnia parasitica CBS 223.65]|uniref:TKL protein kinase n=1 Tax=Saprolegnia parasitica (strain CBS 223.65) TaxID=695850 RepID=A0A067BY86_SAPPC|nr:TKL protein kinase [Saprolegnia parasitica CBS 223.65]KDO19271.1 TKL protein kinase [Saprolegnia parasitica CBS 223.65]|eukprot:XP_012210014.1 TKL protein kinase [Saprolegnia parasitica CBS 223.65]